MRNGLTVDLEDWHQLIVKNLRGDLGRAGGRLDASVGVLLDILKRKKVRATFFVLGAVAEQAPEIVERIRDEGHEIATHGFGHDRVWSLGPEGFRRDLDRAVGVISRVSGQVPIGYRAPAFSIRRGMDWAWAILTEKGFRYDSSVFPILHRRYGIPGAPRFPHWIRDNGAHLYEFPLTTWRWMGINFPAAGGGYLRLFPLSWIRRAIRQMNRMGHPAVVYLHPYEFDPVNLRIMKEEVRGIGAGRVARTEFLQNLRRSSTPVKLRSLLESFSFGPLRELVPEGGAK